MILRRIDPVSLAKILGILYAMLGVLIGALISLASVLGAFAGGAEHGAGEFAFLLGAGAFVIAPVVYGALGAIGGLITALIYNLAAGIVGGVQLDLEPRRTA